MSMGLLVDMPGITKLPSRPRKVPATPQGKLGRSLRRPAASVMSCPVWSSLFATESKGSAEASGSSRPGSRARSATRSQSMSRLDARPNSSQSLSLGPGFSESRPGTCQSQHLSTADVRPHTTNPGSLQMSMEEIEAMGSVRKDGLWWEWQKKGARGWERCGGDTSAELEEAYVLGEPSCRGYDLNAVRNSGSGNIRRVRWPPRPDTALPEPACQLWGGKLSSSFDTGAALGKGGSSDAEATSGKKGQTPQPGKTDGLSASVLVWPPVWADSTSHAFKPDAVGRAATVSAGQRRPNQYPTRETSVSTYVEQDGSKSMFLAAPHYYGSRAFKATTE